MKTASLLPVALLALSAAAASAAETTPPVPKSSLPANLEIAGFFNLYAPADDDTYDLGGGFEAQLRCWLNRYVGGAFAVGGASYTIDEQDISIREPGFSADSELEGYVDLTPVGVSLLLRPVQTDKITLTLEGGVRYVFVDSQAEFEIETRTPTRSTYIDDTADIDDGIVAVALAQLAVKVTDQIQVIVGAGYQFDLEKGDVELADQDLGKNELEALMVQGGIVVHF